MAVWVANWTNRVVLSTYMRFDEFGVLISGLRTLSPQMSVRVVEDAKAPTKSVPICPQRVPEERRFTLMDIEAFDGPKQ